MITFNFEQELKKAKQAGKSDEEIVKEFFSGFSVDDKKQSEEWLRQNYPGLFIK